MTPLEEALARAWKFANSWEADETIDDESGFTASDLRLIIWVAELSKQQSAP